MFIVRDGALTIYFFSQVHLSAILTAPDVLVCVPAQTCCLK